MSLDVYPELLRDFNLELARGNVSGMSIINKFGDNSAIAFGSTETVWDGSNVYTFPATADITHIRQAVDQAAMRSQVIEVQGLDTNYAAVTQNVTLDASNTTTAVALTTALRRVHRMRVLANVVTTQNVELRNVGGGTTYAIIQAGNNQTLMAIYTVPAGYTAYLNNYWASLNKSIGNVTDVIVRMWHQDNQNVYAPQLKHLRGLTITGSSVFKHIWDIPLAVTQKTDIYLDANNVSAAGTADVSAGFDLILVAN